MSQVDVANAHDIVVMFDDDPVWLHLGDDQFVERLNRYLELAPTLRERSWTSTTWTSRFGERVFVRSRGRTEHGGVRRAAWRGRNGISSALDVGTAKVSVIVGELMDDGGLDIIGIGLAESKGIRRGVVNNVDSAAEAIKRALDEAELMAGVEIDSVHLALSGAHVKAFNSRGVVAVAGRNREITREDVKRAIDAARAVALPGGREILHVLPQDFVVDDQDGIAVPVGMTGSRLEVNVHVVTGSSSSMQNMVACVNRAGVEVVDTVLEQLAASEAVLTPDEKELGVCTGRHRRRHHGLRRLRARQPVAHRRAGGRRRPLHERHRRRPSHADSGGGEAQAPVGLRADLARSRRRDDGSRQHRRAPGARRCRGGCCPRSCSRERKRSAICSGTRFAGPATRSRSTPASS